MSLRVHQYVRLWFLRCLVPVPPIHQVLPWISPMHLRYGHHGLAPPCASPPGLYVDTSAILPGIQRVAAQNALGPGRSIPSGPKRFLAPLFEGEPSARRTGGPGRRAPTVADAPRRSASPSGLAGNGPGRGSHGYAGRSRCPCGFGPGPVSDIGKAPWGVCSEGLPVRVVRRRATLPHPVGCSTIAVPGLSFRVRNGTGRLTWAMAAANLLLYGQTLGSAGLWRPGNRTADADMSMFRLVARQCSLPSGAVCRRKMRSPKESGNVGVAFRPLVPVGSTPRGASTSGLSTTCSAWGLQELEGSTECLSWSRLPA